MSFHSPLTFAPSAAAGAAVAAAVRIPPAAPPQVLPRAQNWAHPVWPGAAPPALNLTLALTLFRSLGAPARFPHTLTECSAVVLQSFSCLCCSVVQIEKPSGQALLMIDFLNFFVILWSARNFCLKNIINNAKTIRFRFAAVFCVYDSIYIYIIEMSNYSRSCAACTQHSYRWRITFSSAALGAAPASACSRPPRRRPAA